MFTTRNDSSVGFDFYMYITLSTVTTGINVSFKDEYSTYGYKLFNEDGVSEFNFTNVEAREYYLILKIFDNAECTGNVVEERIVYADYSIFVASNYVFASAGEYTLAYSSNIWSQKFDDSNASKGTLSADNKTISNLSNVNVLSVTSKAQMLDGTIYKVKSKIVVNTTKSISEYLAVKTLNFGTDETQIGFDIENKSNSPISNEVASKVLDQVNNAGYVTIDDDCWKNTETYSYILNSYSAEMIDGYLVIKLNITKTETLVPENTETSEFHLVLDVQ